MSNVGHANDGTRQRVGTEAKKSCGQFVAVPFSIAAAAVRAGNLFMLQRLWQHPLESVRSETGTILNKHSPETSVCAFKTQPQTSTIHGAVVLAERYVLGSCACWASLTDVDSCLSQYTSAVQGWVVR